MANILGGFEAMLARTGRRVKVERPPAMCFLDITGYTHLTQERGDVAAADLASRLARLVERTSVQHGGRAVKWLGDGVMLYFKDPGPGVEAALEMVAGVGRRRPAAGACRPARWAGRLPGGRLLRADGEPRLAHRRVRQTGRGARQPRGRRGRERPGATNGTGTAFREIGPVELKGVSGAMRLYVALRGS